MKRERVIAGSAALLFIILIVLVRTVDVKAVGPAGTKVGLSALNTAFHTLTGVGNVMLTISEICGYIALALAACFAVLGVLQLLRRKSIAGVDREILALGGLYVVTLVLYVFFDVVAVSYRPVLEAGETFPEASFPSSHSMLALVVFMSAAVVADRYICSRTLCRVVRIACCLFTVTAVITRLLSGVHWFTDILGGIVIGTALVEVFVLVSKKTKTAGIG